MPGRDYVASIRDFWRVCSGVNEEARTRGREVPQRGPQHRGVPSHRSRQAHRVGDGEVMENSYRATILAFLDEWSLFAERNGVDVTKVIKAIKVRADPQQHHVPRPGIGGYWPGRRTAG